MSTRAIEKLKHHKLPCGPMDVSVDSVCRRRLHDHLDTLLDRLCEECNPVPPKSDVPKDWMSEPEETLAQKKKKMIAEGKMKAEVRAHVKEHEKSLMDEEENKGKKEPEETDEQKKKRMIDEGKLKAEVKVKVKKHEEKLMGNSKLLADPKQKITTRKKR